MIATKRLNEDHADRASQPNKMSTQLIISIDDFRFFLQPKKFICKSFLIGNEYPRTLQLI